MILTTLQMLLIVNTAIYYQIDDILILGNKVLVTNLPVTGVYFFRITDGTDTWYSELFQTSGYEIAGNLEFSPISSKPGQGGVEVNTPTINI